MTAKEKFEQLKNLDIQAKSDIERDRIGVDLERMYEEDPEGFEQVVKESMQQTLREARELRVKEQLAQVSEIISMSYIAKTYFNKSKSWLSQRINELDVNGKPAQFMPEEIDTLNFAFKDISKKISTVSIWTAT
jgi:hypothetical protein